MSTPPRMTPRATGRADGSDGAERRGQRGECGAPSAANLVEALFSATHAIKYTGRLCMEDADPTLRGISFPRARLLMVMDDARDGRIRMGDLAAALGVTARNVTTIVDGLERDGLLVRKPDPSDRRAILIELTPVGKDHIARVHALQREVAERFFTALDPAERADLLRLLYKIGDAAQPGARTPFGEPPGGESGE